MRASMPARLVLWLLTGAALTACGEAQPSDVSPTPDGPAEAALDIVRTTVVTWPVGDDSGVQVIVEVRNTSDDWILLDGRLLGPQRGTLHDESGRAKWGLNGVVFSGYPRRLPPGEIGYYVAADTLRDTPADTASQIAFRPHTAVANGPPAWQATITPGGFEGVGQGPVTVQVTAEWDGPQPAVGLVIAFDEAGRVIGFAQTSDPLFSSGQFSLCCLPPGMGPYAERISDTTVIVIPDE